MNVIQEKLEKINNDLSKKDLMSLTLVKWGDRLKNECQVYRLGEQYYAKKFDEILYQLVSEKKAITILENNLDAILSIKYFKNANDDEIQRIQEIKKYFSNRIGILCKNVKFTNDEKEGYYIKPLPSSCIAFNNGVYDFAKNEWLFEYDKIKIDETKSYIDYPLEYRLTWCINRNYEPKLLQAFNIDEISLKDFIEILKDLDSKQRNLFFRVLYNMSYDDKEIFNINKCMHLCEILGFLLYSPFVEQFVFFVGDGSNGKDTIFDNCYRKLISPIPSSSSYSDLIEDKFGLSILSGRAQNISSETETGILKNSAMIKQLTGSQFQTIEEKGVDKYVGYLNCKMVFSCNKPEQLKFGDTSNGFRRRINMYECIFQWDKEKDFLKRYQGCYDSSYINGDELLENDGFETFLICALYGIKEATKDFTQPFKFTINDYNNSQYAEIDEDFKNSINNVTAFNVLNGVRLLSKKIDGEKIIDGLFYSEDNIRLSQETTTSDNTFGFMYFSNGKSFVDTLIDSLTYDTSESDNLFNTPYFQDNDFFLSCSFLYDISSLRSMSKTKFSQGIKKNYPKCRLRRFADNKLYVLCRFNSQGSLIIVQ